jgi:hypothetical protein
MIITNYLSCAVIYNDNNYNLEYKRFSRSSILLMISLKPSSVILMSINNYNKAKYRVQ